MTLTALAFAAGAALLQQQAQLPWLAWLAFLPLCIGLAVLRWRGAALFALAGGFLWAAACAHWRMADWLSPELEGRDLQVVGVVAALPALGERSVRFEFDVESAEQKLPSKIQLSWYRSGAYEDQPALLSGVVHPGERFQSALGATPAAGILAALSVGDQRAISGEEWRLFNRTGVTHLMSISGLHVTLISGLFAWLVATGWRRVPALTLYLPARKAAAAAAIVGALGYTLLAGFGVPAQRTFYMVTVVAIALWSGRIASPGRTLALALAAVVIFDPWAPLAPGLWLSFGAVMLIFYVASGWTSAGTFLAQWGRIQWAITVGLAPAVLLLFGQVSVAGPLANAVAIPAVSAVITPLALVAALIPVDALLQFSAMLVELLLQFLEWCAALPGALWQQHVPPLWCVLLALGGAAWLLAPRGVPWRGGGLALMAPAFALAPPAPPPGEAWITTLDVGQGLAVLVRTSSHALLYDAGPAFSAEADSGARVIVPYLRAAGLTRLDLVVLSHEDNDHLGGALSVLESFEADALASSLPQGHALNALVAAPRRCLAAGSWEWDGVRFEFVHPASLEKTTRRNNQSCVLRVASGGGSMLLTGDIERFAEGQIVQASKFLATDVLLVPHHGSRTSSSAEFIQAVAPRWAVVPVGYRNRFGHPSGEVLERYRAAGAEIRRTDLDGAVLVRLAATDRKSTRLNSSHLV